MERAWNAKMIGPSLTSFYLDDDRVKRFEIVGRILPCALVPCIYILGVTTCGITTQHIV
jgi:hypothetical protein